MIMNTFILDGDQSQNFSQIELDPSSLSSHPQNPSLDSPLVHYSPSPLGQDPQDPQDPQDSSPGPSGDYDTNLPSQLAFSPMNHPETDSVEMGANQSGVDWFDGKHPKKSVSNKKKTKTTSRRNKPHKKVAPPKTLLNNRKLNPYPVITVRKKNGRYVSFHLLDGDNHDTQAVVAKVEVKNGLASFYGTKLGKVTSNRKTKKAHIVFHFLFRVWGEDPNIIIEEFSSHSLSIFCKPYLQEREQGFQEITVDEVIEDEGIIDHKNLVVLKGKFPKTTCCVYFGLDCGIVRDQKPTQLIVITPEIIIPCCTRIIINDQDSGKTYTFNASTTNIATEGIFPNFLESAHTFVDNDDNSLLQQSTTG